MGNNTSRPFQVDYQVVYLSCTCTKGTWPIALSLSLSVRPLPASVPRMLSSLDGRHQTSTCGCRCVSGTARQAPPICP